MAGKCPGGDFRERLWKMKGHWNWVLHWGGTAYQGRLNATWGLETWAETQRSYWVRVRFIPAGSVDRVTPRSRPRGGCGRCGPGKAAHGVSPLLITGREMKAKWTPPPEWEIGGFRFIGQTGKHLPKLFLYLEKKSISKLAINIDSCVFHDSCRTAKILTVYLGPVETGRQVPVIGDKAIYDDEM